MVKVDERNKIKLVRKIPLSKGFKVRLRYFSGIQ